MNFTDQETPLTASELDDMNRRELLDEIQRLEFRNKRLIEIFTERLSKMNGNICAECRTPLKEKTHPIQYGIKRYRLICNDCYWKLDRDEQRASDELRERIAEQEMNNATI